MPAFAATMSMRPSSSVTRIAIASTEERSVTSAAIASPPSSVAVVAASSRSTATITTTAPSAASTEAIPRPIPRAAPVTTATWSVRACIGRPNILAPRAMQRFPESDAKYAYSPEHASIGTVQPGEVFEVESVEGYSGYFRSPEDFNPESYAAAEAQKWAVVGPIAVAGAEPGGAVSVTIHDIEITTPGVVTSGAYSRNADPYEWWDDESAADVYPIAAGFVHFDERTRLPTRPLIGCLAVMPGEGGVHAKLQGRYGGNLDCRELRAGATMILPVEHEGAGLYFGDCKALMGDSEIVGPPEVGAVVTASAVPAARPASMEWPRIETRGELMTVVSGRPLEWSARQAFRELLNWVDDDFDLPRPRAALLLAMVAHVRIAQISNTDYTAYCVTPRDVLAPYARA